MADRTGQQFGNYRLVALLGTGSFAEVYLGHHVRFNQQAAIKVLHAHLSGQEAEHFQHEAETIATLAHPAIVRVFDFDVQEGVPFLVMEYAPNGSLRRRFPRGSLVLLPQIISYIKQVAAALQYAHEQKFIHRDVKPENMLLGRREEVLLSDFGLATLTHSSASFSTQPTVGTLAYMAPEQIEGHPRAASDQYALGVVVYEWLCGVRPFEGSITEVMVQHLTMPPPPLHEKVATISAEVEQVVLRALAKEPKLRFASVQDFATALQQAWQEALSPHSTPVLAPQPPTGGGQSRSSTPHLPTGTVTLLFADIEGSTHLLQQLSERYALMLAEYRHLVRHVCQKFRGHEADAQGDAFFGVFARATDAVAAAVSVQRTLTSYAFPEGVAVRVRMGLHTGEPELSTEGYVGLVVHSAARIMDAGHGGQVLLSQTTRDLVEHDLSEGVSLRDLGEHRLKDLQRPERLFQLVISGLPAEFPPLKTLESRPNNLPIQPSPFIGREKEVATVHNLLCREDVRLLTLTGAGGIGKTRLALQVAAELCDLFTDGVYFVNLAPISDTEFVVPTIAQALGIREVAGQTLPEHLKEELRQKQVLLVLDNFEQVVSAAPQVMDLLSGCPKLKVLVTSREVLRVRAEHEFAVPPLALPDLTRLPELAEFSPYAAVALFIQRAQAVKPDFQVTPVNARTIAEICVRLDGLPLAIELAAARVKLLSPQALLARLNQRLQVLTSGARDAPVRQQSLRNTIAWSYDLLKAEEQRLFRRLSVFVGGCTLEAAEGICAALDGSDGTASVLDGVASLIDKSLLQQAKQEEHEARLIMLETIREYGVECLMACGETEDARRAHAMYYLGLAEKADSELTGPRQVAWLEQLEREYANIREVLEWALEARKRGQGSEIALRLGTSLRQFWDVRGYWNEGRAFLERALEGSQAVAPFLRAKALLAISTLTLQLGNLDDAEALSQESLILCRELGDSENIARSLDLLGAIAGMQGNYSLARSLLEQSLTFFRKAGNKVHAYQSLLNLGLVTWMQGDYSQGLVLLEESLVLAREIDSKELTAWSLNFIARILFDLQGDLPTIHALYKESLLLSRELENKPVIIMCLSGLGQVALRQDAAATARSLLQEGIALSGEIGDRYSLAEILIVLANVEARQGDHAIAHRLFNESLAIVRKLGYKDLLAWGLEGLASLVYEQPVWAARLWGVAGALRETIGFPIPPVYRADYERSVASARTTLGERAFTKAWAEGRMMTPEQVLAAQGQVTMPIATLTGLSSTPPTKVSPTYPNGLTAREVEVLRLVAQGLTDAQVAEQLVISPRTVNTHLKSIYGKIGVSSRSAATRYAIEHQLL